MLLGYDTKPPKQKIALLLPDAQYQTIEVYNTFSFTAEEEGKFESVIEKFNACCNPKKNETYERYVFHSRKQLQGEPVEQFVADLKLKAQTCQFDNLRDSMIRDRLVLGVSSQRVRKRLLRQEDLGLDKAVKICQAAEAIEKQILTLAQKGVSSSDTSVNYCNKRGRRQQQRKPFQPSTKQKPATKCSCCDTTHAPRACPAYGKACNKCGKSGHFARVCRSKPKDGKVRCVSHYDPTDRYVSHYDPTDRCVSHYDPTDGTAEMFVDMVKNADTATDNKWTQKLRVDNCTISFKLDTGSAVSIISAQQCIKPAPKLEKSLTVMTSYGGTRYQA